MKYVLSVLGIIVFGIIAVILFSRATNNNSQNVQVGVKVKQMTDYINDRTKVEFTQYGAVVADENRRTLRISVSENERSIEVLKGYNQQVEKRQTYYNNKDAYNVFIRALDNAGYSREKKTKFTDPTGVCPQGKRFEYKLKDLNDDVSSLWNSTCQPLGGTIGGNTELIRALFRDQVPDYRDVVKGVTF